LTALELARWQFGITTVFHFLFVPLSIGMAVMVASFQTAYHRTNKPAYLRLTKFWGKIMLLSFAVGVVTGIVQEFQFGMNWSNYSRFVGDVFGAPLAMEALIAFFLESTFLGLWIFGWGRLKPALHLTTIWLAAIGSMISAYFILAANSWMQHPVGFKLNADSGRAEMESIWAVLTQQLALATYAHTILAALTTAGMVVLGVSAYFLWAKKDADIFRMSAKVGAWVALIGVLATMIVGDVLGKIMTDVQPMKMAAAEALYETEDPAAFSLLTVSPFEARPDRADFEIAVPGLLSFLANGNFDSEVQGANNLQAQYEQEYGPGEYRPFIGLTYWTFRLMIGAGMLIMLLAAAALWFLHRGALESKPWFNKVLMWGVALPFIANSTGWIFTEMGRQPWVVFGLQLTRVADSPSVDAWMVAVTLIGFTLIYAILGGVAVWLGVRFIKKGAPAPAPSDEKGAEDLSQPSMAY
jgi:cytochrome d ubiquinol oxidase subunit I